MRFEENQLRLSAKFKASCGYMKFIAMVLLIYSEYLFLSSPICLNGVVLLSTLYPCTAFIATLVLTLTYIAHLWGIPNSDATSWVIVEVISSLFLLIGMIWTCNVTLSNCERPLKTLYLLPEALGLLVSTVLVLHSLFWLYMFSPIFAVVDGKTLSV